MATDKEKPSAFKPLLGFVIAVIVAVIGWLVAPGVIHGLATVLPNFAGNELPLSTMRIAFTAILFVLALIVFALVAALLAPKDTRTARESQLEKERDSLRRRQKAERAERRKR